MSEKITTAGADDPLSSQTDWARVDAMTDAEIVYDEDTGPPLTKSDIEDIVENGFKSHGLKDFQEKMRKASA